MVFSYPRLLLAWVQYRRGKRRVATVEGFELSRETELLDLVTELAAGTWRHSPYREFIVSDPKPRRITAAAVRDRVVHQVVFEEVERAFEPTFLPVSFSARKGRGVHLALDEVSRAIERLRRQRVWPIWTLKGDVRKFYDSIDHRLLLRLLARRIKDPELMRAIESIVGSSCSSRGQGKGIPIGNLTSQVFANVYLHELDRYAVHGCHAAGYFRYADDVLVLGGSRADVEALAARLRAFANENLALDLVLRPARVLSTGVDFLGSILWPYGRTLRPKTRTRVIQRVGMRERAAARGAISPASLQQTRVSYNGIAMRVRDRRLKEIVRGPAPDVPGEP
jgi:retron-type reverse transcriptase